LRGVIAIVLTTLLAVLAGVALERRSNRAAQCVRHVIVQSVLWLFAPFVAFVNLVHLDVSHGVGIGLLVAMTGLALTGLAMWLLARGPLGIDRPSTGAAVVCTIQANTGFFGLPLCAALFSHAELVQAVAYDSLVSLPVFVVGSFGVGAVFGTTGRDRSTPRHVLATLFSNPLIPVIAVALLAPEAWSPEWLEQPALLTAYALAPLGFVVVGITLADEAEEGALRVPPPLTRPVATVVALRMLAMPALVIAVSVLLIDLPAPFLLLAAMPTGLNTILVGHQTGLDLRLTVNAIVWTNAIAIVAILGFLLVRPLA
jgi:predicted permease